jgi:hypothetical protein
MARPPGAPGHGAAAVTGPEQTPPRRLHPLPRGLVELYGLLAVLFVLVPEWMAGGALLGFRANRRGSDLPAAAAVWQKLPELRLAAMGMAELRLLAREQRIAGYAGLGRDRLSARLIRRLKPQEKLQQKSRKALW